MPKIEMSAYKCDSWKSVAELIIRLRQQMANHIKIQNELFVKKTKKD